MIQLTFTPLDKENVIRFDECKMISDNVISNKVNLENIRISTTIGMKIRKSDVGRRPMTCRDERVKGGEGRGGVGT